MQFFFRGTEKVIKKDQEYVTNKLNVKKIIIFLFPREQYNIIHFQFTRACISTNNRPLLCSSEIVAALQGAYTV